MPSTQFITAYNTQNVQGYIHQIKLEPSVDFYHSDEEELYFNFNYTLHCIW